MRVQETVLLEFGNLARRHMTPRIHLHILASGSKGNAAVVEGPCGSVLIDCGISRRSLLSRADELGVDMERVQAVLLTHEHSDHVSGLSVFCNHFNGGIFATAGTLGARKYLTELPATVIDHSDCLELCGMQVKVFPTSHDVADPIGFRFEVEGSGHAPDDAVGYCTDTGMLTDQAMTELVGCRILALESNHDENMLATGPYPGYLKRRIASNKGHLSNDQAAAALQELLTDDTEVVVGMHLSQENNRPSIAVRTLSKAVGAEAADSTFTEARTPDGHLSICVASQDAPISLF